MNGNKGIPDTIYLQVYGDSGEVGNEEEIRSSDVTWSEERVYPTDVVYHRAQSSWISVSDALPELRQRVLVLQKTQMWQTVFIMKRIPHDTSDPNNGKWHWSNVVNDNEVTHWMPIPSFDDILNANKDVLKRLKEKGD